MTEYDFSQILEFFSEKLGTPLPETDLMEGLDLRIDAYTCAITPGKVRGGLTLSIPIGMLLQPVKEERLTQLATSNFLGVNAGGCTIALDDSGVTLSIKAAIAPGTPPHECWEWLHRLFSVSEHWRRQLAAWEESLPLGGR